MKYHLIPHGSDRPDDELEHVTALVREHRANILHQEEFWPGIKCICAFAVLKIVLMVGILASDPAAQGFNQGSRDFSEKISDVAVS